ncbi:MAG: hypothetical protein ACJAR4_000549, partial [Psychroserpens sp.]
MKSTTAIGAFFATKRINNIVLSSLFFLLTTILVNGQNYTTTGLSNNWEDATAWDCSGGNCNNNPFPNYEVGNSTITITHDIVYNSSNPIKLKNNSELVVLNNANFITMSNINVNPGGLLLVDQGGIEIGPGVLKNRGTIQLTNAVMIKNGNFINDSQLLLSNTCVRLTDGNFLNNGAVSGLGSIKAENGNINNSGTWDASVIYFYSQSGSGLPSTPSTEAEVTAVCECILINCDILPGYPPNSKVDEIIGSALTSLFDSYTPGDPTNEFIYIINENNEVLIEVVAFNGQFA